MEVCARRGDEKKRDLPTRFLVGSMAQTWALGPRTLLAGLQAKSHLDTWGSLMASRHKLQGEAVTVTVEKPVLSVERVQTPLTDHQEDRRSRPCTFGFSS